MKESGLGTKPGTSIAHLEELGTAVKVGQYEDGTPEWHAARAAGIGGSDIASILGIGFVSRYMLWMHKAGVVPRTEEPDNPFFEWGHRLEPVIAEKFRDMHGEYELITETGSWHHRDRRWQLANPDGFLVDRYSGLIEGILEIKTSMTGAGWGPESDEEKGVPAKYLAQVRWYLGVFGFAWAKIVVLIGLADYREYYVFQDEAWLTEALLSADAFMFSIGAGQAPPIDGGKDTYKYLRETNPSIDPKHKVQISEEMHFMVKEARGLEKLAEAEMLRAKGHLLAHMGTAKTAMFGDTVIANRIAKGGGVPYVQFK
jgi:putative phage-type endonuclease